MESAYVQHIEYGRYTMKKSNNSQLSWIRQINSKIRNIPYVARYFNDVSFRMKISLYQGVLVNSVFAGFHLIASWIYSSLWYSAIAAYNITSSIIRFQLLRSVHKVSKLETDVEKMMHELRWYRFTGYLLLALNIAMVGMIILMVQKNSGYHLDGVLIYAFALYAFYSLIMAIINMVKYRNMDHPVLSAAKMVSVAVALMSILALQTAMFSQFGQDDQFRQYMNTATGAGVSVIVFSMAIFMVVRANRAMNNIQANSPSSSNRS